MRFNTLLLSLLPVVGALSSAGAVEVPGPAAGSGGSTSEAEVAAATDADLDEILARTTDGTGRGAPNGSSADPDFLDWLEPIDEPDYGSAEWPVAIGGYLEGTGHAWSKQYFASLLGPHGEPTTYERLGSCCDFALDDPKFKDEGLRTGFLDIYAVRIGDAEPTRIHVSLYHEDKVYAPKGFTTRGMRDDAGATEAATGSSTGETADGDG